MYLLYFGSCGNGSKWRFLFNVWIFVIFDLVIFEVLRKFEVEKFRYIVMVCLVYKKNYLKCVGGNVIF